MHIPPAIQTSALVIATISLLALVIRMIGPWRKQIDELEARMRNELRKDRALCEAELKVVKHRERRTRQLIYSTLRLFDLPQSRRAPILKSIREELSAIEQAEALESGIVSMAGFPEVTE